MDAVTIERSRSVAIVTLNRPDNRNALGRDVKAGLEAAIPDLMADRAIGCLVITGRVEPSAPAATWRRWTTAARPPCGTAWPPAMPGRRRCCRPKPR